MNRFFLTIGVLVWATIMSAQSANAAQRVLAIGDDLVVEAATEPGGYLNELRATLAEEQKDVEIVALGKRGATFADWRQIVADSYQQDLATDVDGVSVKTEFDKGADLVVVNLGLNDVLKPSIDPNHTMKFTQDAATFVETDPLSAEIAGLVTDLKKRLPGVKRVFLMELSVSGTAAIVDLLPGRINNCVRQAARETEVETIPLSRLFMESAGFSRFAKEEIALVHDSLHPNEHGAKLVAWTLLLCLNPDYPLQSSYARAISAYRGPRLGSLVGSLDPPLNDWENLAKRYYETKVDERLRDSSSPGFYLNAHYNPTTFKRFSEIGKDEEISVEVMFTTRGIEADQPLTEEEKKDQDNDMRTRSSGIFRPALEKRPKFETVSSGNLRFEKFDPAGSTLFRNPKSEYDKTESDDGRYCLRYKGVLSDLPAEIVLRVGGVEKSVKVERRGDAFLSSARNVDQAFSGLEDFPQEKAITGIDYATMAKIDPMSLPNEPQSGRAPLSLFFQDVSFDDGAWLDVPKHVVNSPYAGVYIIRYVDSPREQSATLKLGAKGKTRVVERVYLNGANVFFGELDGADPNKSETTLQTTLKEGRNVLVARVDHTLWDWIVKFEFFDSDGAPM